MIDLSKMQLRRVAAMAGTDAGTVIWQNDCGHVYHYTTSDPHFQAKHQRHLEDFAQGHQFVRRCTGCEQGHTPKYAVGVDLLSIVATDPDLDLSVEEPLCT